MGTDASGAGGQVPPTSCRRCGSGSLAASAFTTSTTSSPASRPTTCNRACQDAVPAGPGRAAADAAPRAAWTRCACVCWTKPIDAWSAGWRSTGMAATFARTRSVSNASREVITGRVLFRTARSPDLVSVGATVRNRRRAPRPGRTTRSGRQVERDQWQDPEGGLGLLRCRFCRGGWYWISIALTKRASVFATTVRNSE
jgi:hypothetical protein